MSTIDRLHDLINHPRTPETERNVARRMLQRVMQRQATVTTGPGTNSVLDHRNYGSKYENTRYLGIVDIARRVRADLRFARTMAASTPTGGAEMKIIDPIGDAPAAIKFGVKSATFAGGTSIDITIKNIPDAWGWTERDRPDYGPMIFPTDALRTLATELAAVLQAFNYDGSDSQTDHFDVRFFAGVSADNGICLA